MCVDLPAFQEGGVHRAAVSPMCICFGDSPLVTSAKVFALCCVPGGFCGILWYVPCDAPLLFLCSLATKKNVEKTSKQKNTHHLSYY